jgi:hypothetical protein
VNGETCANEAILCRRVAIKKIPKDFGGAFDFVNSFARELRSLYVNLGNLEEAQRQHRTPAADDAESDMSGGHCSYLVTLYDAYIERYPICLCLVSTPARHVEEQRKALLHAGLVPGRVIALLDLIRCWSTWRGAAARRCSPTVGRAVTKACSAPSHTTRSRCCQCCQSTRMLKSRPHLTQLLSIGFGTPARA